MTPDDEALDVLWRERFGQPLPILGAGDAVRAILAADPAALAARPGSAETASTS
ncbi:MAG: hypothetical protein V7678_03825 [Brevundimonas sp.]